MISRERWLEVACAVNLELQDLLPPDQRLSALEELLARLRQRAVRETQEQYPPPVPEDE